MMSEMKTRLNGQPIIYRAVSQAYAPAEVVIVYRHDDYRPFVVAHWASWLGNGWAWGSYCADIREACEVFNKRVKLVDKITGFALAEAVARARASVRW
jgi:hypothetical protein